MAHPVAQAPRTAPTRPGTPPGSGPRSGERPGRVPRPRPAGQGEPGPATPSPGPAGRTRAEALGTLQRLGHLAVLQDAEALVVLDARDLVLLLRQESGGGILLAAVGRPVPGRHLLRVLGAEELHVGHGRRRAGSSGSAPRLRRAAARKGRGRPPQPMSGERRRLRPISDGLWRGLRNAGQSAPREAREGGAVPEEAGGAGLAPAG